MTSTEKVQAKPYLYEEIIELLKKQFEAGEFLPGERFMGISQLIDQYGVSSATARRVLSELEQDGLIDKARGRGCYVREKQQEITLCQLVFSDNYTFPSANTRIESDLHMGLVRQEANYGCKVRTLTFDFLEKSDLREMPLLVAIIPPEYRDRLFKLIEEKKHRCVCYHNVRPMEGIPTVRIDLRAGVFKCVKYLLDRGYKRLALLNGERNRDWYLPRYTAFLDALQYYRAEFSDELIIDIHGNAPETEDVDAAMDKLLSMKNPPDAVLGATLQRGLYAVQWCRQKGISVPNDMAVMTIDNYHECDLTNPSLTALDLNGVKVGAAAVDLLLKWVKSGSDTPPDDVLVAPDIVVRKST